MLLACNAVHLHEIAPPAARQKLAMRTQVLAPLSAAMLGGVLGYYWMPDQYVRYLSFCRPLFPTFAVQHVGWTAPQLFLYSRIRPVPFVILVISIVAAFGERYERKTWCCYLGARLPGSSFSCLLRRKYVPDLRHHSDARTGQLLAPHDVQLHVRRVSHPLAVGRGWMDRRRLGLDRLLRHPRAQIPSLMRYHMGEKRKGAILEQLSP